MEANMHLPFLPLNLISVHLETNSFWLRDDQWFQVVPLLNAMMLL
jgi:hypothetical protein